MSRKQLNMDFYYRYTHRGTKATIDLEDGKLVQVVRFSYVGQLIIRDDLLGSGRLDTIPFTSPSISMVAIIWNK